MSSGGHLRLPDELKQKITHSSKELNRSMNADIVARLEKSFEQKCFESLESVPMKELAKRLDGFSVVVKNLSYPNMTIFSLDYVSLQLILD